MRASRNGDLWEKTTLLGVVILSRGLSGEGSMQPARAAGECIGPSARRKRRPQDDRTFQLR